MNPSYGDQAVIAPGKKRRGRPRKVDKPFHQPARVASQITGLARKPRRKKLVYQPRATRSGRLKAKVLAQSEVGGDAPTVKQPTVDGSGLKQQGRVLAGQAVHGVVEGSFDAGYLIKVRIGDSDQIIYRGMVFGPGMALPVDTGNDVAPKVKKAKRMKGIAIPAAPSPPPSPSAPPPVSSLSPDAERPPAAPSPYPPHDYDHSQQLDRSGASAYVPAPPPPPLPQQIHGGVQARAYRSPFGDQAISDLVYAGYGMLPLPQGFNYPFHLPMVATGGGVEGRGGGPPSYYGIREEAAIREGAQGAARERAE